MPDYRSRSRYVWRDGKLVEIDLDKAREVRRAMRTSANVLNDISESFISPVDGSVITSRAELREHNARNGVVDIGDEKNPPMPDNVPLPPMDDVVRDSIQFLESLSLGERKNYLAQAHHTEPEDQRFYEAGLESLKHNG